MYGVFKGGERMKKPILLEWVKKIVEIDRKNKFLRRFKVWKELKKYALIEESNLNAKFIGLVKTK